MRIRRPSIQKLALTVVLCQAFDSIPEVDEKYNNERRVEDVPELKIVEISEDPTSDKRLTLAI